jgi:5-methylcytosine-specific restriction endonuclease McrA
MKEAYTKQWPLYSVRMREPKIDPRPTYQRGLVWSKSKKQLLMDSILRRYDIPKLYLRAVDKPPYKYEVVDGQQRLHAIWKFCQDDFPLSKECDPVHGHIVADKRFSELPNDLVDDFQTYELSFVILEDTTEDEVEEMFTRLNNGETLTTAEKRNAMPGDMKDFVRELAFHPLFGKVPFKNTRYAFDQVCAQMTCLELASGPTDTKARDLERMYKDHIKFDRNARTARKIKRVLNFLDNAFTEKTPELGKENVVSLYLLASELVEKYAMSGKETTFREWFINFEKERREERNKPEDERDPDWVRYQEKTMQAVNSKDSIEFRHKMLMTSFLLYYPELELPDPQRTFTEEQRITIFRKYGGICQGCGKDIKWDEFHADHIKPFSKGGKTTVANGQLLCAKCNLEKAAVVS